jgi:hypothetical protein
MAGCPTCGTALPVEGKCVSCNLPPRHAAFRLTGVVLALLGLLGIAYLLFAS